MIWPQHLNREAKLTLAKLAEGRMSNISLISPVAKFCRVGLAVSKQEFASADLVSNADQTTARSVAVHRNIQFSLSKGYCETEMDVTMGKTKPHHRVDNHVIAPLQHLRMYGKVGSKRTT